MTPSGPPVCPPDPLLPDQYALHGLRTSKTDLILIDFFIQNPFTTNRVSGGVISDFLEDWGPSSDHAHARACSLKVDAMIRSGHMFTALAAAAALVLPGPGFTQSTRISVEIDQAQRVQLRGPAGSVIVGNPEIADVTVVDSNTLYITGKGYGVTEIVAVDTIGRTVFQSEVVVTDGAGSGRVRIWRGAQATEMACAASCSPSVRNTSGPAPATTP